MINIARCAWLSCEKRPLAHRAIFYPNIQQVYYLKPRTHDNTSRLIATDDCFFF